jgi:hypothetical protein
MPGTIISGEFVATVETVSGNRSAITHSKGEMYEEIPFLPDQDVTGRQSVTGPRDSSSADIQPCHTGFRSLWNNEHCTQ